MSTVPHVPLPEPKPKMRLCPQHFREFYFHNLTFPGIDFVVDPFLPCSQSPAIMPQPAKKEKELV